MTECFPDSNTPAPASASLALKPQPQEGSRSAKVCYVACETHVADGQALHDFLLNMTRSS